MCTYVNCMWHILISHTLATWGIFLPHLIDTLMTNCRYGHLDIILFLANNARCPVDVKDNNGSTALHLACRYVNTFVVTFAIICTHTVFIYSTPGTFYNTLYSEIPFAYEAKPRLKCCTTDLVFKYAHSYSQVLQSLHYILFIACQGHMPQCSVAAHHLSRTWTINQRWLLVIIVIQPKDFVSVLQTR